MTEPLASLQGVWKTLGYSKILEISGQSFSIYDLSALSCKLAASGSLDELLEVFDRLESPVPGRISLFARGGITRYTLEKVEDIPQRLLQESLEQSTNPQFNFEVFWRYFQENYAFFELRGINWQQIHREWYARIHAHTQPEVLLDAIKEILIQLDDSHATLSAGDKEISTKKPHALVRHWQREFNSTDFLGLFARGIPHLHENIQKNILNGAGRSALQGQLLWGRLFPEVGYIAPFSLMDIYGGFDQLHFAGFEISNPTYLQQLENALDEVMDDLGGVRAILLDLRFNLGGHDSAGLAIAQRFADQERLIFTKQARSSNGFTVPQSVFIQPVARSSFTRPVALLTSAATASAAEVLVHGMMVLPHVLRLGSATRGVLSDMLVMQLPNGWKVSLSNEVYRAADGNCYEGRGVPPQVETITFVEHAFYESLNLTIDQALESLGLRRKP